MGRVNEIFVSGDLSSSKREACVWPVDKEHTSVGKGTVSNEEGFYKEKEYTDKEDSEQFSISASGSYS